MPLVAEGSISITAQNVTTYKDFHRELSDHLQVLIRMTKKYPVEIEFRGLRFVFDSEDEIRKAMENIAAGLREHGIAA